MKRIRLPRVFAVALSILFSAYLQAAVAERQWVLGVPNEPEMGLDPILGWGQYGDGLIQSTLLKRDADFQLQPDVAIKVMPSADRLTWTVKIRNDVLFGDGSPLKAKDVAFTYRQLQQSGAVHDASMIADIIVDDSESLRFVLHSPDLRFVDLLASVGIVPAKQYNQQYAQNPVGSGPFRFVRWDKGQQIVLEKNPYYYSDQPQVDKLIIVFSSEENLISLVKTGQVQLATVPHRYAQAIPNAYQLINVPSNDNRGIVWPMNAPSNYQAGNVVSSDMAIRHAIDQVIDRDLLVQRILQGFGRAAFSLADGLPWGTEKNSREPIELEVIKEQLQSSGWILNDKTQLRSKGGITAQLTLYYPAGDSLREQLALTVSAMVEPLGIKMMVRGGSWAHIKQKMMANPVVMGFGSHSINEMFMVYASEQAGNGWYNSGFYRNTVVDANLAAIKQLADYQQAKPYWSNIYQQLEQDLPWTWLVNIDHLYAVDQCLDIGTPLSEPHQHGWPILRNISQWQWRCH